MNKQEALTYLKSINDAKIQNMRKLERRYQESGLEPFGQQDINTNSEIRFTDDSLGDEDTMYRDEARSNLLKLLGKKNEERVISITDTNILNDDQIKELALYWEDYEQPLRKFEGRLLEFNRFKSILQDLLNAGIRRRQPVVQQPVINDGRTNGQEIPETPEIKQSDIYKKLDGDQTIMKDFGKNPMFVDDNDEDMPELEEDTKQKETNPPQKKSIEILQFLFSNTNFDEVGNLKNIDKIIWNNGNKGENVFELQTDIRNKFIELGFGNKQTSFAILASMIADAEGKKLDNLYDYVIDDEFISYRGMWRRTGSLKNFKRQEKIQDITNRYNGANFGNWNDVFKEFTNTGLNKNNINDKNIISNKLNTLSNKQILDIYNKAVVVNQLNNLGSKTLADDNDAFSGKGIKHKPHMKIIGSKYYIDSRKVGKGILEVRYLKNRHLTNLKTQNISDDMKPIVSDIVEGKGIDKTLYNKLSKKEKNLVGHLAKMSQNDEEFDDDEFTKEFQIIVGQIEAGNNSEMLKQKLRSYIFYGVKIGKIPRQQAYDLMIEFGL